MLGTLLMPRSFRKSRAALLLAPEVSMTRAAATGSPVLNVTPAAPLKVTEVQACKSSLR